MGTLINAQTVDNMKKVSNLTGIKPQNGIIQGLDDTNKGANQILQILGTVKDIIGQVKGLKEAREMGAGQQIVTQQSQPTERVKTIQQEVKVRMKPEINIPKLMQDIDTGLSKAQNLPDKFKDISIRTLTDNRETFSIDVDIPFMGKTIVNYQFVKNFLANWLQKNIQNYLVYKDD